MAKNAVGDVGAMTGPDFCEDLTNEIGVEKGNYADIATPRPQPRRGKGVSPLAENPPWAKLKKR